MGLRWLKLILLFLFGDSYAGTTGIDVAPALGYMKTVYSASFMGGGRIVSQLSAGDAGFADAKNACIRIYSDYNLTLSGTVLSQPDSTSNTNTLDDSIIRVRWRNLTIGGTWQNENPTCTDGSWTFSIAEGDFNSEVSNQFEAYAYAVSDRNLLPMSDLGNTVWLKKPAAAQGSFSCRRNKHFYFYSS